MAIGDRTGRVHEQRQGTGLATIFDIGRYANDLQARAAAKAKNRSAAIKKFEEFDPEYWYRYDSQIQEGIEKLFDEGSDLMMRGVTNPWTGTDPDSIEFQRKAKRLEAYARGTMQMKGEFDKLQGAYNDKQNQKLIGNWDEVAEHFMTDDVFALIESGKPVPSLRFNDPAIDSYKTTSAVVKGWKERFPERDMTPDDAIKLAQDVFSNDAYREGAGGGYIGMLSQAYAGLDPSVKKVIDAEAENEGVSPQEMYAAKYLESRTSTKPINLLEQMWASADSVKMEYDKDAYENQSGVTTTDIREFVKNKEKKAEDIARSYIHLYPGQVKKDVDAGLYGSPQNTIKENSLAALEYYKPKVEDRFADKETDTTSRESGSGFGNVDPIKSAELWYANLTSGESIAMQNATGRLRGVKMPDGTTIDIGGTNEEGIMVLRVTGKRKFVDKWSPYEAPAFPENEEDSMIRFMEQAGGKSRTYEGRGEEVIESEYRINVYNPDQEEYLKTLYYESIKLNKAPFSRDYRTDRRKSKGGATLPEID